MLCKGCGVYRDEQCIDPCIGIDKFHLRHTRELYQMVLLTFAETDEIVHFFDTAHHGVAMLVEKDYKYIAIVRNDWDDGEIIFVRLSCKESIKHSLPEYVCGNRSFRTFSYKSDTLSRQVPVFEFNYQYAIYAKRHHYRKRHQSSIIGSATYQMFGELFNAW